MDRHFNGKKCKIVKSIALKEKLNPEEIEDKFKHFVFKIRYNYNDALNNFN